MQLRLLNLCLFLCLLPLLGCAQKIVNIESKTGAIICFGDSITMGEGSNEGNDYPSLLSKKLGLPVLNAGVSGDTTRDALKRIEQDVLRYKPRLIIVEFLGNDFLQHIPRKETLDNLDKITVMIQQQGAMVVLIAVRAGFFRDHYYRGLKYIAKKRGALLVPNIMKGIFSESSLKSDMLHPNNAGYRIIADRIYKAIRPILE